MEIKRFDVVKMKHNTCDGWRNYQCVEEVHHESLSTISLWGHNQHYKVWDIEKVIESQKVNQQKQSQPTKRL